MGQVFDIETCDHPIVSALEMEVFRRSSAGKIGDTFDFGRFSWSAGAELRLDTNLFYAPVIVEGRLGYVRRVLVSGKDVFWNSYSHQEFYFLLGTSF